MLPLLFPVLILNKKVPRVLFVFAELRQQLGGKLSVDGIVVSIAIMMSILGQPIRSLLRAARERNSLVRPTHPHPHHLDSRLAPRQVSLVLVLAHRVAGSLCY